LNQITQTIYDLWQSVILGNLLFANY